MSKKCNSLPVHPEIGAGLPASNLALPERLPDWVPSAVRLYLAHTEQGRSLRDIARAEGVHASTVLRQVRRFENRRDDPLIEHLLGRIRKEDRQASAHDAEEPDAVMSGAVKPDAAKPAAGSGHAAPPCQSDPAPSDLPADEAGLLAAAAQYLPYLAREDTLMAVAADMDKAVILRDGASGSERLAVLDRTLAEAFALREWIRCRKTGRVAQYVLAAEGRACLRRLGDNRRRDGTTPDEAEARFRPTPEAPVAILARRRDRDGQPFLAPALVAAAERLLEDFEISQTEPGMTMDWERLPLGRAGAGTTPRERPSPGGNAATARARVKAALAELGPGLGDIALRCCCWQEGVETAEQKLGWSARSGKIVLRIALERLARHYAEQGEGGKMIG